MAVNVSLYELKPKPGKPGRWRLRCRVTGQRDTYRFLPPASTRSDALAAAAAWRAEVTEHGRAPASPSITLGAWLDQLMTLATHLQPNTRDFYDGLIKRHFAPLAGRRIGQLTPADGLNFQRLLLDNRTGPVTVRHCFRLARWALAEAARLRIIPANPFATVRAVRGRPADVKVPGATQLRAIGATLDATRVGLLLRLALASGARRSELLALTWQHIDLDGGTLQISGSLEQRGCAPGNTTGATIRVKPPKTQAGRRTVQLPPGMLTELRTARAAAGETALAAGRPLATLPVLPGADGVSWWSPMAATQAAKRALAAAGLPGSLHGLRHAHATTLLQARINPRAVQQRLGHATVATTLTIYAHAMPGDDAAAAAAIAAATESLGEGPPQRAS